ncbi:MAG: Ni/Fe hydrogenase subunit alpha [Candidatus Heimdallarchaeota archaeon]|nr:MAG: Ni/Fe hydrogenase subunit alpha [Candidatus Heimdallarchaeota archaeon]
MSSTRKITIDPVTRLEGNAKITFELDESTNVLKKAEFQVLEFRAFEKFLEGRKARETPRITPRICGICPVSHHLCSAKATDMLARVIIPGRAKLHRELMHMGQFIHSHSLHVYFLALPDFVDGFKAESNDFRLLLNANPTLVKNVIRIRAFGQKVIEILGGKAIHPVTAIPGGISVPLKVAEHEALLNEAKKLLPITEESLTAAWGLLDCVPEELKQYETLNSHNMGTVGNNKEIALYDGETVILDSNGKVKGNFRGAKYRKMISEKYFDFSWTKFPYFINAEDEEDAIIQVGPLARQKCYETISTEKAGKMLANFRQRFGRYTTESYSTHYARIIETMYALEKTIDILEDPNLMKDTDYRISSTIKESSGVGIVEAPRGSLIHSFQTDQNGLITKANIIVSTTFNNPAINLALFKVAKKQLDPSQKSIPESTLRQIESTVRIFDPCLTCSSHSLSGTNFDIVLRNTEGELIYSSLVASRNSSLK